MKSQRVLLTGAGGMLANALQRELAGAGAEVIALDHAALDVTMAERVEEVFAATRPQVVIQCAAFTRVDDAESEEAQAFAVNASATAHVAAACRSIGARLVYPSTDYVFDGTSRTPYTTDAPVDPINAYGRSKAAGEEAVRQAGDYLIVRTSWLYGPGGRNFVRTIANRLAEGAPLRVVDDQLGSPTWTTDLARSIVAMLRATLTSGVFHVSNAGVTSWYELASEIARGLGSRMKIQACKTADYPTRALRPHYSVLDCTGTERLIGPLRDWRTALAEALRTRAF